MIAGRLPGRTDNEIKNYWNTHIKRKLLSRGIDPQTHRQINGVTSSASPFTGPQQVHQTEVSVSPTRGPTGSSEGPGSLHSIGEEKHSSHNGLDIDLNLSISLPLFQSPKRSSASPSRGLMELEASASSGTDTGYSNNNLCLCYGLGFQNGDQACSCYQRTTQNTQVFRFIAPLEEGQ